PAPCRRPPGGGHPGPPGRTARPRLPAAQTHWPPLTTESIAEKNSVIPRFLTTLVIPGSSLASSSRAPTRDLVQVIVAFAKALPHVTRSRIESGTTLEEAGMTP